MSTPSSSPALFSLLVVDDEPDLRTLYELTLLREGYEVETAGSVGDAWALLQDRTYSAVITDMRLPDGTGLDLLQRLERAGRREKAVVITAYGSAENAVEALKAGAFDYLTKPVDLKQFRSIIASALGRSGSTKSAPPAPPAQPSTPAKAPAPKTAPPTPDRKLSPDLDEPGSVALKRMSGASPTMQQVRALIRKVARSMAPVWIHGESGTGKELVARAIHEVSARATAPFIAVNCGAIPEQLLEAEFFGYRKGAFTGANEDREGFFQAARGGTLFLDEIGDLPLSMQSKLLRSIQERAVRPVGAVNEIAVDVRIVSATHKDLAVEVAAGRFRQDLYYRLNVIQIRVPALRERMDDLTEICAQVLARIAEEGHLHPAPQLSDAALDRLASYAFPGNVRELENLLHRAVALSGGHMIEIDDLGLMPPDDHTAAIAPAIAPATTTSPGAVVPAPAPDAPAATTAFEAPGGSANLCADLPADLPADLAAHLDAIERDILLRALAHHRYNRTAAGASLGLSLRQMRYRMARLGIQGAEGSSRPGTDDPASIE